MFFLLLTICFFISWGEGTCKWRFGSSLVSCRVFYLLSLYFVKLINWQINWLIDWLIVLQCLTVFIIFSSNVSNLHALYTYALVQNYCSSSTFVMFEYVLHCILLCTCIPCSLTVKSSFLSFCNNRLHFIHFTSLPIVSHNASPTFQKSLKSRWVE